MYHSLTHSSKAEAWDLNAMDFLCNHEVKGVSETFSDLMGSSLYHKNMDSNRHSVGVTGIFLVTG